MQMTSLGNHVLAFNSVPGLSLYSVAIKYVTHKIVLMLCVFCSKSCIIFKLQFLW